METAVYNVADYGIGIFITIGILIFRFVLKQSQKKGNTKKRSVPQPNLSDFASTSEDAIAQMLGEFKSEEKPPLQFNDNIIKKEPEVEVEALEEEEFKRDSNYRIKRKRKSTAEILIDSSEELKRAVILQEIIGPPVSQRKRS